MRQPLVHLAARLGEVLSFRVLVVFLALGTCLLAVIISTWRMDSRFDALASLECESALSAYDTGGPQKLLSVMQRHESESGVRAWLFDENGHSLGGGPDRSSLFPVKPLFSRLFSMIRGRYPSDARAVGHIESYSCVVISDLEGFHRAGHISSFAFLSILCSTIAAYVILRMRRLETAISRFGAGGLEIRVPSDNRDPVRRLSQAFNQMADRVESLIEAHRRLCIDISHELRSPLTRLRLAIGLTRSGTRGALEQIELESFRLNDLVDQLLDVARAEVDPTVLKKEIIDMRALMAEVADDCAIDARERGCELDLRMSQPGTILGDPELLRRAIENPLRNAIRHSRAGSIVELTSGGDADCAVVSIRDQGPGVPESSLQEIFRPFYRVEADRDRGTGGTGLGLAIVERAVALHRGSVKAENSAPGLRVEIRLPRK